MPIGGSSGVDVGYELEAIPRNDSFLSITLPLQQSILGPATAKPLVKKPKTQGLARMGNRSASKQQPWKEKAKNPTELGTIMKQFPGTLN